MTHWTEEQHREYLARFKAWASGNDSCPLAEQEDIPDPGPERDLQGKIQKYCKENGYPCF